MHGIAPYLRDVHQQRRWHRLNCQVTVWRDRERQ
jgi:hypothetical protein